MRVYVIKHNLSEKEVEIKAINSEVVQYCHEFYIEGINGELLTARYASKNWDIIHVEYPKELLK
tara:strand:+ start:1467 stop:1658 length:192 start_codon:yes stop_codon:yes gene_type:complete